MPDDRKPSHVRAGEVFAKLVQDDPEFQAGLNRAQERLRKFATADGARIAAAIRECKKLLQPLSIGGPVVPSREFKPSAN